MIKKYIYIYLGCSTSDVDHGFKTLRLLRLFIGFQRVK